MYRGILEELRDPSESLITFTDYIYADLFWTLLKYTKSLKYNAAANSELDFLCVLSLRRQCREARDIFKSEKFQQRQSEDEWITLQVMDTFLNLHLMDKRIASQLPRLAVADEFTKATMKIQQLKLATHTMFAAAVMKDVHRVIDEDIAWPYQELKNLGPQCRDSVKHADPSTPRGRTPDWLAGDTHYATKIMDFSNYIGSWILPNIKDIATKHTPTSAFDIQALVAELPSWADLQGLLEDKAGCANMEPWNEIIKSMSQQGLKCVSPSKDPLLAFKGNPLLCRTLVFNL